jgi:DNA (cytosine-5)-methyltransferase 1
MRVADLFSGCGGMTTGFQMAGHEVVFAAENWDQARLVYDANFQHAATRLDLSDIVAAAHAVSMESPDIIVGGPPCQDFSVAGLRAEAERANLTLGFAEIVRSVRPAWFVMENVPAAATSRAWRAAKARLRSAGYGMTEIVLDASLYGVPQLRRRLFLIGHGGSGDQFLEDRLKDAAGDTPLTVRGYLGDEFGITYYYRHPRHWGRRAIYSIDEPAATVRSTNRPIPPKYTSHELDAAPVDDVKPLTSLQRARLQTFSTSHQFYDGLFTWEVDLMIGNAVPVQLAWHVAAAIAEYDEVREVAYTNCEFRECLLA